MRFFKMNGLGNDYIFIAKTDCATLTTERIKQLCDVHTGIGADGVVTFEKGQTTDLVMSIYNRDGSEAEMCGNALRCLIKYFSSNQKSITVQTSAGVKRGYVCGNEVTINLGKCVSCDTDYTCFYVNNRIISGKKVNVGNQHFVIKGTYNDVLARTISEDRAHFPDRTNVEFMTVTDEEIFLRVYERGCGETMACGTGAAAAFVASEKKCATIRLPGGILKMSYSPHGELLQTGKADINFTGEIKDV